MLARRRCDKVKSMAFVSALVAHTVVHGVGGVRFLMTFRTAR